MTIKHILAEAESHLREFFPDGPSSVFAGADDVRLVVVFAPNISPRSVGADDLTDQARDAVSDLFDGRGVSNSDFLFPERWMSVGEERAFIKQLLKTSDFGCAVRVITGSPVIVSDTQPGQLVVMQGDDLSNVSFMVPWGAVFGADPSEIIVRLAGQPDSMGEYALDTLDGVLNGDVPVSPDMLGSVGPGFHRSEIRSMIKAGHAR